MTKEGYVCRKCGEVKPLEAYKRWNIGPVGALMSVGRCHYCLDCQAKEKERKRIDFVDRIRRFDD